MADTYPEIPDMNAPRPPPSPPLPDPSLQKGIKPDPVFRQIPLPDPLPTTPFQ